MINTESFRQQLQTAYQTKFNSTTTEDSVVLSLYADLGEATQNGRERGTLHIYADTLQIVSVPSNLAVTLDKETFIDNETTIQEGTYTITYDEDANAWKQFGTTYNLATHGFSVTGTPSDEDVIEYSYMAGIDYNVVAVNGIFSTDAMSLSAVKKPVIGVINGHIEILCPESKKDLVQGCLDAVAEELNATTTIVVDENDKEYTATWSCQTATPTGIEHAPLGEGKFIVLKQDISFVIIESGLSACDTTLLIDGYEVPKLTFTETKVATTSQSPSESLRSESVSETESYGIDFSMPYMTDELTEIFVKAMNKTADNVVHAVCVQKDGKTDCYQMIIGKVAETVQPPQNVGLNVSLLEALPTIAKYDARWKTFTNAKYYITGTEILTGMGTSYSAYSSNPFAFYVFFGDGTGDYITSASQISQLCHYYEDNTTRTIQVMKCVDWKDLTNGATIKAGTIIRNKSKVASVTASSTLVTLTANSVVLFTLNTTNTALQTVIKTTDGVTTTTINKPCTVKAEEILFVCPADCTVGGFDLSTIKLGYRLSETFTDTAQW